MAKELRIDLSILRQTVKFLESLSQEEIRSLEAGEVVVELSLKAKPTKKIEQFSDEKLALIKSQLEGFCSREEGVSMIRNAQLSKAQLQRIARMLDLPNQKDDSVERLIEKVVEATIGFRLRSRAVSGG